MYQPMLVEPGAKYFIGETLKQCHQFKETYKNTIYNIIILFAFFAILGLLLLYKYKGKLTPQEIEENERKKRIYILSKIRNYQDAKIKAQQELITGLPHWENEFDIISENKINMNKPKIYLFIFIV